MAKSSISKVARLFIERAIDRLFDRAKMRLFGPGPKTGKNIIFHYIPDLTLKALFDASSKEEGVKNPNADLLGGLLRISESYLDAQREKTKAQTIHTVQNFIRDAATKNVDVDVEEVLGGQLTALMDTVSSDVRKIVETETTIVRNMGIDDAIQRLTAVQGIDDPSVYFVVVRDGLRCKECTLLHLMEDGITPRVWKRSAISSGYHKKGSGFPAVGGLHPHCRCVMSVLLPGFGFDSGGRVVWKGNGFDHPTEEA